MADDTGDNRALLLQINADLRKLKNDWDKANGIYDDAATKAERRIKRMANQVEKDAGDAGQRGGKAFAHGFTGEAGKAVVFNRMQMMELAHVGRSVFDGLAAGASPTRLLAMEGGRLAEALGSGQGGVGGSLKAIGGMINPYVAAMAAIAAVVLGAAAAEQAYEKEHQKLLTTLMGSAAASGLTVESLEKIVETANKVNHATVAVNNQASEAFLTIGHMAAQNLPGALALLKDYAAKTGQDIPTAIARLAKAFGDPSKGALDLARDLNYLNGEQLNAIEKMDAAGDRAGAQAEMIRDLASNVHGAAGELNGLGEVLQKVAGFFKDAWEWAGKFGYEATHNDQAKIMSTMQGQLVAYQQRLKTLQQSQVAGGGVVRFDAEIKATQKAIDTLTTNIKAAQSKSAQKAQVDLTSRQNETSLKIQADIATGDPKSARVAALRGQRASLDTDLTDAQTLSRTAATSALRAAFAKQIDQIKTSQAAVDKAITDELKKGLPRAKKGPADQSTRVDNEAQLALDHADQAKARELAAANNDILVKAQLEKDAVDQGLKTTLDSLDEKIKANNENKKITTAARIQADAQLQSAKGAEWQAALLKKGQIDQKANSELIAQQAANAKVISDMGDEQQQIMAGVVATQKQRYAIDRQLLADRQAEARAALERKIAAPGYTGDAGHERSSLQDLQRAQDKALAVQQEGPLKDYLRNIQSLDQAAQGAAVDGIETLNSSIIQLADHGGKAADVLKNVLTRVLDDLLNQELQSGEASVFKHFGIKPVGARADGGPVKAGRLYKINERGEEGFVPGADGFVVPHNVMRGVGGNPGLTSAAGSPVSLSLHSTYQIAGAVGREELAQAIGQAHDAAVTRATSQVRRNLPGWMGAVKKLGT